MRLPEGQKNSQVGAWEYEIAFIKQNERCRLFLKRYALAVFFAAVLLASIFGAAVAVNFEAGFAATFGANLVAGLATIGAAFFAVAFTAAIAFGAAALVAAAILGLLKAAALPTAEEVLPIAVFAVVATLFAITALVFCFFAMRESPNRLSPE